MSGLRSVAVLVVFLVAFGGTLETLRRGLESLDLPPRTVGLNVTSFFFAGLDEIRNARARHAEAAQVAFLGDSLSLRTHGGATNAPAALRAELAAASAPVEIHSLAALGMGPFDYYFLADELAAARPEAVVIAFSLQSFGDAFRELARPRLSGWLDPARVPRALLRPLHWVGLRADDLLANVAIVRAGYAEPWRQLRVLQTRFGAARDAFGQGLADRVGGADPRAVDLVVLAHGRRLGRVPGRDRYALRAQRRQYGPILRGVDRDHPVLEVLADTLKLLRSSHIAVLVYVNPINVAHLASLGLPEGDGLARSLETLRSVVVDAGGSFVDLHDRVPEDDAFWDAAGHMGTSARPDALERGAAALVEPLLALLGEPSARVPAAAGDQNWK